MLKILSILSLIIFSSASFTSQQNGHKRYVRYERIEKTLRPMVAIKKPGNNIKFVMMNLEGFINNTTRLIDGKALSLIAEVTGMHEKIKGSRFGNLLHRKREILSKFESIIKSLKGVVLSPQRTFSKGEELAIALRLIGVSEDFNKASNSLLILHELNINFHDVSRLRPELKILKDCLDPAFVELEMIHHGECMLDYSKQFK